MSTIFADDIPCVHSIAVLSLERNTLEMCNVKRKMRWKKDLQFMDQRIIAEFKVAL